MTPERVPPPLEGPGFDAAWYALEAEDRRRITRAVRRGEPLEDPVDAAFAVRVARQRQAPRLLWAVAILGVFYTVQLGLALAHGDRTTALFPGILLAGVAVLALGFLRQRRRAREAERRNLRVLQEQP
jgi:hypothetical protein